MIKELNKQEIIKIEKKINKLKNNECYMGVINLSPNNIHLKENALFEVIKILKEQLKFYKKIYLWCYIENNIAFRFHKLLINKLNAKQEIIKEKYSLIEVNYENL